MASRIADLENTVQNLSHGMPSQDDMAMRNIYDNLQKLSDNMQHLVNRMTAIERHLNLPVGGSSDQFEYIHPQGIAGRIDARRIPSDHRSQGPQQLTAITVVNPSRYNLRLRTSARSPTRQVSIEMGRQAANTGISGSNVKIDADMEWNDQIVDE